jgi:hypothetical protein
VGHRGAQLAFDQALAEQRNELAAREGLTRVVHEMAAAPVVGAAEPSA